MPAAPTRLPMFGRCLNGFASSTGSSCLQLASSQGRTTQPLRSSPITGPSTLLRAAPPLHSASVLSPSRLEPLAASPFTPSAWQSTGSHVPYESLVELRAAYMPDAARAVSGIPRADPGGRVTPRFWHRLNRFRHFCGGSLALASLDLACRNLVPAFPQRSPPRLLTQQLAVA